MLGHDRGNFFIRNHAGAHGVDGDVHGASHSNRIRHLDLALGCQASGHHVLCYIASRIGSGAVHLGGIFAGESATAVGASTTIGVDNDLATSESTVALGTADHESAGGVDQIAGVFEPLFGEHGFDDFFHHRFDKGGLHFAAIALLGAVLSGEHHGVDTVRLAVDIAHCHLAFGVGAQKRQTAVFSQLRLTLDQAVSVIDGGGHELRRF